MAQPEKWTQTTIDSDTLVYRARKNDDEAWRQIDARYRPLVIGFGRSMRLDFEGAEEAAQAALGDFAIAIRAGRFDRQKGRLRDYLFRIARNRIIDSLKMRSNRERQVSNGPEETDFWGNVPGSDVWETRWEAEWQVSVNSQCLLEAREHFSAESYLAFYLRVIEERPSKGVAELLGKTVNAVDLASHRVRQFIKRIRPAIESSF